MTAAAVGLRVSRVRVHAAHDVRIVGPAAAAQKLVVVGTCNRLPVASVVLGGHVHVNLRLVSATVRDAAAAEHLLVAAAGVVSPVLAGRVSLHHGRDRGADGPDLLVHTPTAALPRSVARGGVLAEDVRGIVRGQAAAAHEVLASRTVNGGPVASVGVHRLEGGILQPLVVARGQAATLRLGGVT